MRTTVTLDPDVERLIQEAMRERGISLDEALNEAARSGLRGTSTQPPRKFVQKTYPMGSEQMFDWDKARGAADSMADAALIHRLDRHK